MRLEGEDAERRSEEYARVSRAVDEFYTSQKQTPEGEAALVQSLWPLHGREPAILQLKVDCCDQENRILRKRAVQVVGSLLRIPQLSGLIDGCVDLLCKSVRDGIQSPVRRP